MMPERDERPEPDRTASCLWVFCRHHGILLTRKVATQLIKQRPTDCCAGTPASVITVTYWLLVGSKRIYYIWGLYRDKIPIFPTNHRKVKGQPRTDVPEVISFAELEATGGAVQASPNTPYNCRGRRWLSNGRPPMPKTRAAQAIVRHTGFHIPEQQVLQGC